MPVSEDRSFKITWRLENFFLWAGYNELSGNCPCTPNFAIETLGNTEWWITLCTSRHEPWNVMYVFRRAHYVDVEDDVDVYYTIYTLGHDSSPYSRIAGISNPEPGHGHSVTIIPAADIRFVDREDDLLSIVCEIRKVEPTDRVYFSKREWKDEYEKLSDNMRRLFDTGYLSDLKLVSDDGRRIAVHSFVLIARWSKLCDSLSGNRVKNRIAVHGVSGSALYAFVSYLYSGTLSASDVTAELFDFALENVPRMRKHFHSLASDVCMRTQQRKEELNFTLYADNLKDDSMPFFRVLPLQQVEGDEIVIVFDIQENQDGERCLSVSFSLSNPRHKFAITFECSIALFIRDLCIEGRSGWGRCLDHELFYTPCFIPMRLLTNSTKERLNCPRVEIELVISDMPHQSVVENWVTEFRTGSRGVRNVERLSADFRLFRLLRLGDVTLRTERRSFSSRAVLSVRSRTFQRFFRNQRKGRITVGVKETDSVVLAGVLEYVFTGWTMLWVLRSEELRQMIVIAKRLCLTGLAEKCQHFIDSQTPCLIENRILY